MVEEIGKLAWMGLRLNVYDFFVLFGARILLFLYLTGWINVAYGCYIEPGQHNNLIYFIAINCRCIFNDARIDCKFLEINLYRRKLIENFKYKIYIRNVNSSRLLKVY